MRCNNCGNINPDYALFCATCGRETEQQVHRCAKCGVAVKPPASICNNCESQVAVAGPVAVAGVTSPSGADNAGLAIPTLDLQGLLAKAFQLFRQDPGLFWGIGLIAQAPSLLAAAVLGNLALEIALGVAGFVVVAIAEGAVVSAVVTLLLNGKASVASSYSRAQRHGVTLVGGAIIVLVVLALMLLSLGLSVILIGIPFFVYLIWRLVSLVFYPQAVMVENKRLLDSLGRSHALVRGNWWRVLGIALLLAVPIYLPPAIVIGIFGQSAGGEVVVALLSSLGLPWTMIGTTLLYIDLRARKEGLTLDTLRSEMGQRPISS